MSQMQLALTMPKLFHKALIIFLGITVFLTAILFHQPVDAATQAYRQMAKLGLVDAIVTPQEIGLDYLAQPPVQLANNSELMNVIHWVNEGVKNISDENMPLKVDLCNNSPVKLKEPDKNPVCQTSESKSYEATGLIDADGKAKDITGKLIGSMTNTEYQNQGDLQIQPFGNSLHVQAQNILLADASGRFLQARRLPTFTLIVRNKKTGKRYIARGVNPNSFCRDVLNSFARGKVRRLATNPSDIS